jgi:Cdc6-like AAA superfamily ATPase
MDTGGEDELVSATQSRAAAQEAVSDRHQLFKDLYPTLDDPQFNEKIAQKREFFNARIQEKAEPVEERAAELANADFELAPHQLFVQNFLSMQTPYNSLLVYAALGTGKTITAIGVCEEMREYMDQMSVDFKPILVVASPNVQANFKAQLFDESALFVGQDGLWTIRGGPPVGRTLLREINPTRVKGMTRERVVSAIHAIIQKSYQFIGYDSLANYIERVRMHGIKATAETEGKMTAPMIRNLEREFGGRLLVIDEVHNIRVADNNSDKKRVAQKLLLLVELSLIHI